MALRRSDYAPCLQEQRLIYSGKVLKDPETLESYNVKDGHTVHMVRGAPATPAPAPAPVAAAAPVPAPAPAAIPTATPVAPGLGGANPMPNPFLAAMYSTLNGQTDPKNWPQFDAPAPSAGFRPPVIS